jgi:hypothetical protein
LRTLGTRHPQQLGSLSRGYFSVATGEQDLLAARLGIDQPSEPLSGLAGDTDLDLVAALVEGTVQRVGIPGEQLGHDPPPETICSI